LNEAKETTEVERTMLSRRAGTIVAAIAVALGMLVGASGALAAKAPRTFYGVVPQTDLSTADIERMGQAKVGTLRTIMLWGAIDPSEAPNDNHWAGFDAIVREAATNGIEVFPFIFGTPQWVAKGIDNQRCNSAAKCYIYAPKSAAAIAAWKNFVGEAVARYGRGGDFWQENPGVPEVPISDWQFWNEMNSKSFFAPKPKPKSYAKLLSAAADATAQADPSAQVVLGGMAELAGSRKAIPGSEYLEDLYDVKGVKDDFDGIAPHPYGATIGKVSAQVEEYRRIMKRSGDSRGSVYVTEVGAGSASGGNSLNRGTKGQAELLTDIFKYFQKKRNSFNIETVNWFSWQDAAQSICSWCKTSGLLKQNGKAKPSYKAFAKLTGGSKRPRR
jgi:hypothetical protein